MRNPVYDTHLQNPVYVCANSWLKSPKPKVPDYGLGWVIGCPRFPDPTCIRPLGGQRQRKAALKRSSLDRVYHGSITSLSQVYHGSITEHCHQVPVRRVATHPERDLIVKFRAENYHLLQNSMIFKQ